MYSKLQAYIELTKPRIVTLVVITAALGFYLGGQGITSWTLLTMTLFGTALSCSGASVLNQYLERDADSRMKRTLRRPLVTGSVCPGNALSFGILLVLSGTILLV